MKIQLTLPRPWLYLVLPLLCLLTACGSGSGSSSNDQAAVNPLPAGSYMRSLVFDNQSRTYTLVVPESAQSGDRLPLVLLLHGATGDASTILTVSDLAVQANESGFLIAAIEGIDGIYNAGLPGPNSNIDDVGFASAVIDEVSHLTPTDTQRTYAAGFSQGGAMAYRLACQLSDRIAAVMVVSGFISNVDQETNNTFYQCNPSRPVPILHLHGLADTCVRFEGGMGTGISDEPRLSIPETIGDWAARNSCSAETETVDEGILGGILDTAQCERQLDCAQGADVQLCTLDGHGHVWPSGTAYSPVVRNQCGGRLSRAIDTNEAFWEFVSRFSLGN